MNTGCEHDLAGGGGVRAWSHCGHSGGRGPQGATHPETHNAHHFSLYTQVCPVIYDSGLVPEETSSLLCETSLEVVNSF